VIKRNSLDPISSSYEEMKTKRDKYQEYSREFQVTIIRPRSNDRTAVRLVHDSLAASAAARHQLSNAQEGGGAAGRAFQLDLVVGLAITPLSPIEVG